MAIYIDNVFELYTVETGRWIRDDIPMRFKQIVEEGLHLKIRNWDVVSEQVEVAPDWLKDDRYSISDDELSMLGYVEQSDHRSIILTKRSEDFPLHACRTTAQHFGAGDLGLSIFELPNYLSADLVFIALDLASARELIASDEAAQVNAAYITNSQAILLRAGAGPSIIFTELEELVPISTAKQFVINRLRSIGCRYLPHHGGKRVVITDGTIDADFFDHDIALFFRSSL